MLSGLKTVTMRLANIASKNTPLTGSNLLAKGNNWSRSLWHMSKNPELMQDNAAGLLMGQPKLLTAMSGMRNIHTKGERELVEFLTEEIVNERKTQKIKTIPSKLAGFDVKLLGADVELTKNTDKEKIVVSFNVNHTVDTEEDPELEPQAEKPNLGEMRSKPQFEIDFIKGNTTLSFTCSYLQGEPQEGEYNDVFGIDEFCIFEGQWNDKVYAVAGDVLDGYLYDLLMNLLEEKGISNEFAEQLSDLATAYEHTSYIALLEGLSKFTTGK